MIHFATGEPGTFSHVIACWLHCFSAHSVVQDMLQKVSNYNKYRLTAFLHCLRSRYRHIMLLILPIMLSSDSHWHSLLSFASLPVKLELCYLYYTVWGDEVQAVATLGLEAKLSCSTNGFSVPMEREVGGMYSTSHLCR